MRLTAWLVAAALPALLVTSLASPAQAATGLKVSYLNASPAHVGVPMVVVVTSLKKNPVKVTWGDGVVSRVAKGCTGGRLAKSLCIRSFTHVYTAEGPRTVRVASGTFRSGRPVTVSASALPTPPAPAPAPAPAPSEQPAPDASSGTTPFTPSAPASSVLPSGWQQDMLAQVNALRAAGGVAPVSLCAPLESAAQSYTTLMAEQNHYSHVGPDGSQPWDRGTAAGYTYTSFAENIAGGLYGVSAVVDAWRQSAGHYANIMNPVYTHAGFGYAYSPSAQYGTYWAQEFATGGTC